MENGARKTAYRAKAHSLQVLQMPVLCAFFAAGALLAHAVAKLWSGGEDLALYLRTYAALSADGGLAAASFWQAAVAYLRYPFFALLFGFCSFGVAAIPLLLLVQGFSLSFAASVLGAALGRSGVLLALAAFGVRGLVTVVVTLLLASWSLERIKGNGSGKQMPQRGAVQFGCCVLLLLIGIVLELTVVPKLILPALGAIQ